jgi:hypothetical protein
MNRGTEEKFTETIDIIIQDNGFRDVFKRVMLETLINKIQTVDTTLRIFMLMLNRITFIMNL